MARDGYPYSTPSVDPVTGVIELYVCLGQGENGEPIMKYQSFYPENLTTEQIDQLANTAYAKALAGLPDTEWGSKKNSFFAHVDLPDGQDLVIGGYYTPDNILISHFPVQAVQITQPDIDKETGKFKN